MNRLRGILLIFMTLILTLAVVTSGCSSNTSKEEPKGESQQEAKEEVKEEYTIRFSTSLMPPSPEGSIPLELEKIISERTNGRVKFKAYVGGQLYDDFEAPLQVQAGAIEMAYGGSMLSSLSPGWDSVSTVPFLFDDFEHYKRFTKTEAYEAMNAKLEEKGIKVITDASASLFSDYWNNVKPVKMPEDFKGLKIRIPPIPGLVAMAETLGIQSVTITTAEVSNALQTGMVDGLMTSVLMYKDMQLAKTVPYVLRANMVPVAVNFIVNAKFWNSLPPDLQQILQEVFEEAAEKKSKMAVEIFENSWKEYAATPGNVITTLTPEEKEVWRKAAQPVWDMYKEKSEEHRMVIEAANSVR